jgi:hypothetical protein
MKHKGNCGPQRIEGADFCLACSQGYELACIVETISQPGMIEKISSVASRV